jgi:hypothetical protein
MDKSTKYVTDLLFWTVVRPPFWTWLKSLISFYVPETYEGDKQ